MGKNIEVSPTKHKKVFIFHFIRKSKVLFTNLFWELTKTDVIWVIKKRVTFIRWVQRSAQLWGVKCEIERRPKMAIHLKRIFLTVINLSCLKYEIWRLHTSNLLRNMRLTRISSLKNLSAWIYLNQEACLTIKLDKRRLVR